MEQALHEGPQEDEEHPGVPASHRHIRGYMVFSSLCIFRYSRTSQRLRGFPQELRLTAIGNTLHRGSPCTIALAIHSG